MSCEHGWVGYHLGVVLKILKVAHKEMLFTLCIIHRERLAAKKLPTDLQNVLSNALKTVNEVRSGHLNSRLFKTLRERMDS